jgi:hypothetical protein
LQFQLYMSSQFYPEWRATVADGTQRKPPPQIHTVVICAALGLQKADFGGRWLMCWRLLIPFHHDMRFGYERRLCATSGRLLTTHQAKTARDHGTRARSLDATINRTRPLNIVIWRTSERW